MTISTARTKCVLTCTTTKTTETQKIFDKLSKGRGKCFNPKSEVEKYKYLADPVSDLQEKLSCTA